MNDNDTPMGFYVFANILLYGGAFVSTLITGYPDNSLWMQTRIFWIPNMIISVGYILYHVYVIIRDW